MGIKEREQAIQQIRKEYLKSVGRTIRMANIILPFFALCFIAIGIYGCEKEEDNCNCNGQFVNIETAEYTYQQTDCDRIPPEGYVFVKCMGEPKY